MVTAAVLLQLLIIIGALYDTARLLTATAGSRPRGSRHRRRRAELEAAERRLVAQRLGGEIGAAPYRAGMRSFADGHRHRAPSPPSRHVPPTDSPQELP
ncbi:hypothetical protein [Streptomyces blattellae]|uniref:hypothetical protein n=1 Tax=Streptomyces blattellae TaxID=2569855 RepID=UPI0012B95389|nr:hypothetical protein [Streptomyces blattellae]